MRLIEVGDDKYQVLRQIESQDPEFIERIKKLYGERYNDFFLLEAKTNPAVQAHHLICRKIDDIEFEDVDTT